MFDIGKKISRAWNTIWHYKVLWIFGFLLVLFGSSGGGGGGGGGSFTNSGYQYNNNDFNYSQVPYGAPAWVNEMATFFEDKVVPLFMPDRILSTILWTIGIAVGIALVCGLLAALVRYPAETAVMRMVDDYEATGTKVKFKAGWKLGWNRRAFRIWVIDLIIGSPAFVVVMALVIGSSVMMVRTFETGSMRLAPGMVALMVLAGFLLLLLALLMIFVSLWRELIVRQVAIDDQGIGAAFKKSWAMLAHNAKNAFLTWLVMIGLGMAFGIVTVIALVVLIPAFAVMTIPGAVVGAIPGAIAFGITSIFGSSFWPWIIGGMVFLPFFFMVTFSPATLLGGIYSIFSSSIWTQTYREMKGIIPPVPAALPPLPVVDDIQTK